MWGRREDGTAAPTGRQRALRGRILRAGAAFLVASALAGPPLAAQARPAPDDAFRDTGAAALVTRARAARARDIVGIESYEGLLRERMYVGLTGFRFRRERGLFEQERVARIRWEASGDRAVQWLAARQAVPVVGADTRDAALDIVNDPRRAFPPPRDSTERAAERDRTGPRGTRAANDTVSIDLSDDVGAELATELPEQLLKASELPAFPFEPNSDRLSFGEDWALHPLADTALAHYRYRSGDTLRVRLPDGDVTLYEVRVEPRRADYRLVAGSLWFDATDASLVRATYRPARPFDLAMDDPDEDVPGWIGRIEAELAYVTVEYSFHESRYWLPRRFAVEGEARVGSLVRIPLTVEWTVSDYTVNEAASELLLDGPLPPGWRRSEEVVQNADSTEQHRVTMIVAPADSLLTSGRLTAAATSRTPSSFSREELAELREGLDALLPTYRQFRPRLRFGPGVMRYNRVEGLSVGTLAEVPLSPRLELEAEVRYGLANEEVHGGLSLWRGSSASGWRVSGYRRLVSMNDLEDPFSLPSSVLGLVLGTDQGQFFRATGASVGVRRTGVRTWLEAEVFREEQAAVGLGTDFYLTEFFREDTVAPVLAADPVTLTGGRGTLRWYQGRDPDGWILAGALRGEAAWGDARYRRLSATASVTHPLPFGLAGGLEVGGGTTWTDGVLPVQRSFFLGGSETLRGFNTNEIRGDTYWRAKGELGTGFAGARLLLFGDLGWAGPRGSFTMDARLASVGVGTSLLDGLFRVDLARAVRGDSRWKVHVYLDGLF